MVWLSRYLEAIGAVYGMAYRCLNKGFYDGSRCQEGDLKTDRATGVNAQIDTKGGFGDHRDFC